MTKVPTVVRFRYTGEPTRSVILFDQEMNPGWLVLFFWGTSLSLALLISSVRIREMLGWK